MRMTFMVNTSAFAGREGKYVTSRNIKDRLDRELERNLALRVEPGETADQFVVSGRGALHISILIENMRREGFEFQVGPPRVSILWCDQARLVISNQLLFPVSNCASCISGYILIKTMRCAGLCTFPAPGR